MKKVITFILFLCAVLLLFSAQTPSDAAKAQLNHFLQSIMPEQLDRFGFSNPAELSQVKIEPCFRVESLSETEINQWNEQKTSDNVFVSDSLHLFPLSVKNQFRCMLAVDYTKGEWKAVSIGYRELARKMDLIRTAWAGSEIKIIRVYPLQRYYYVLPNAPRQNCTLIRFKQGEGKGISADYLQLTPISEAMTEMREAIKGGNHEN